jgi:hypothetical protein
MLGDTLTVTLGGSGGTARVCNKINQDNYSSEYVNRNSTDEIRVKVRHSFEKSPVGSWPIERHNVEFTQTVFSGDPTIPDTFRQVYLILRNTKSDDASEVSDLGEALSFYLTETIFGKLINLES